jgi:uncharacterized protein (DUF885 family)
MSTKTETAGSPVTELAAIGREFWEWRHRQAPATRDDICRVRRPAGWTAKWTADDVTSYQLRVAEFADRLARVDMTSASVPERVDARLLRSAIARVRWELDDVRNWACNPSFYVDQSLGAVFELLLRRPPFDAEYVDELMCRLSAVPAILAAGLENLANGAFREYCEIAVGELSDIAESIHTVDTALSEQLPEDSRAAASDAFRAATKALESFAASLTDSRAEMGAFTPVGRERFLHFLREIACVSWSPEELASIGLQEWRRAVLMETIQAARNGGSDGTQVATTAEAQCAIESELEQEVRDFYSQKQLLTLPDDLGHYLNLPMPAYLWPLRWLGVTDDLTDARRLDQDSVSYVPTPSLTLPYFHSTNARDPRIGITHEGAHYMQLAMSWAQSNEIRREYYDSVANEGIAYYNEELMIHAGLFDDTPHSLQVMYNLMRLRGLRVNVDLDLVLGNISILEAGERLRDLVPMDETTAFAEAGAFASTPGLGLSYVIGKHQIFAWIAAALLEQGAAFDLGRLHDFLWRNGNVPIELLQEEYAAQRAEVESDE